MALRVWRRVLQGLGVAMLLVAITIGALVWRLNTGKDCLMFGDSYTPIREVKIDGRPYYVYGAVTGFQDKARFVQLSTTKMPETVCNAEDITRLVDSEVVDDNRRVTKVLVGRQRDGKLSLTLEYATDMQRGERLDWEGIAIEVR
jgi:hypothetical protein